jgi:hypothetical protein
MKKLLFAALTAAAIASTTGAASAQGAYSGYRDVYAPHPYYDEARHRRHHVSRHHRYRYYRRARCPRGYTVQDGVCKPYRGY